MTIRHDEIDPILQTVAALPTHDVSPDRGAELRQRCHAALGGGGTRPVRPASSGPRWSWQRVLEPAMVAGVSAIFLLEVVRRALLLEGF